jgi:hypothetical protein
MKIIAFPLVTQRPDGVVVEYNSGMDLRDYFAAKALQGLLATVKDETWFQDEVASICYEMADKMMKAREQ